MADTRDVAGWVEHAQTSTLAWPGSDMRHKTLANAVDLTAAFARLIVEGSCPST